MERVSFKMVKDGNRTVIVIEGAAAERDAAAFQVLQSYCGLGTPSPSPTIPVVEQLEPVAPTPTDTIPSNEEIEKMTQYADIYARDNTITGGPYQGKTARQALASDKSKALAVLYTYVRKLAPSKEREDIIRSCKQFMRDLPMTISQYPKRENKVEFLQNVSTLMHISTFVNGYQDFGSFCQFATDEEIETCFLQTIKTLQDRADKNHG